MSFFNFILNAEIGIHDIILFVVIIWAVLRISGIIERKLKKNTEEN